jgi:cleavage and polyadenylation specificity factor subunit 1
MKLTSVGAKSQSGRRLLHRSTFHTGHFPISMHLLPSTLSSRGRLTSSSPTPETNGHDEAEQPPKLSRPTAQQVLVVTQTGVLALITPIDELMYLRLNAMQTYLTAQLDHACGLNPRGYRAVESERMGIKGIVDGTMLMRWAELPKQRRVEASGRIGTEEMVLRSDLELIAGGGLGYF